MPNIRSQSISSAGLSITATNGKSFSLTAAQILTHQNSLTGTTAAKQAATNTWVAQQIAAALGAEMVPTAKVTHDYNTATGAPTLLQVDR